MDLFKEFVTSGSFSNTSVDGYTNTQPASDTSHAVYNYPDITLTMPMQTLEGRIMRIIYNRDPIRVHLSDGSTWQMSKGQFDFLRKSGKEPVIGKVMSISIFKDGTVNSISVL